MGDLISREEILENAFKIYTHECGLLEVVGVATIKTLPSVKPQEPQTGHWKRISIDKYSEHAKYWYRCDRCGKDNLGNTDFCPSCGARMIEKQESEVRNERK